MRFRVVERAAFISGICVLFGVILLLSSYVVSVPEVPREFLREIGILLFSLGTISAVYEFVLRRQMMEDIFQSLREIVDPDSRKLGLTALYRSRDEKIRRGQSIDDLIKSTQHELFCVGLGLLAFVPERQALIKQRIQQGARFKFLVFDADSPAAEMLDRSLGTGDGELVELIRAQTRYIVRFVAELNQLGIADHFEARVYDVVPTFGLVEIDSGHSGHKMIVEINGFRADVSECPGFTLVNTAAGWSTYFRECANRLWDSARIISPSPS